MIVRVGSDEPDIQLYEIEAIHTRPHAKLLRTWKRSSFGDVKFGYMDDKHVIALLSRPGTLEVVQLTGPARVQGPTPPEFVLEHAGENSGLKKR